MFESKNNAEVTNSDAVHQLWIQNCIYIRLVALVGQAALCLSWRERRILFPPPFGADPCRTVRMDAFWNRDDVPERMAALSATGLQF